MNAIYCRVIQPAKHVIINKRIYIREDVSYIHINNCINRCASYAKAKGIKIDLVCIDDESIDHDRKVYKDFVESRYKIDNLIAVTISAEGKGVVGNVELYELFRHKDIKLHMLKGFAEVKYLLHFYDKKRG